MSAANHDLVIDQGSTFVIDLTIKESGSLKNLTGFSGRAQMRSSKTASAVAASFTCTIANPTNGVVKMELPATTSTAMAAGVYFYDLDTQFQPIIKDIDLIEGTATINQEVTR